MEPESPTEDGDAAAVDLACQALVAGGVTQAEALLRDVVSRAPATYQLVRDVDGKKEIRFWDQNEFLYYVQWHNAHGTSHAATWKPSAYPRAHYYLGFINVKLKRYEQAVTFLKSGAALEPTNLKFGCELAQALIGMRQLVEAAALYVDLAGTDLSPHVSPLDIARANRGCGFVFIELGELDEARTAYLRSLKFEPESKLAKAQLAYVEEVRNGRAPLPGRIVDAPGRDLAQCKSCGRTGQPGTFRGLSFVCESCDSPKSRPWWAFWKRGS
ncbi:MAG: hypothetical protein HOW73_22465 [Polyangiaceae bacterium]|nr:hypothetical protein [Polyangiaceae bacterium]